MEITKSGGRMGGTEAPREERARSRVSENKLKQHTVFQNFSSSQLAVEKGPEVNKHQVKHYTMPLIISLFFSQFMTDTTIMAADSSSSLFLTIVFRCCLDDARHSDCHVAPPSADLSAGRD